MRIKGELEIDENRGVIYFHLTHQDEVEKFNMVTLLRICRLPTPIPTERQNLADLTMLDITHMHGCSWHDYRGEPEDEDDARIVNILGVEVDE